MTLIAIVTVAIKESYEHGYKNGYSHGFVEGGRYGPFPPYYNMVPIMKDGKLTGWIDAPEETRGK